jgi:phage terminase large subunit-like protein
LAKTPKELQPIHVEKANQYIRDVLGGTIPACRYVRAACQRQLDDLARQDDPAWPFFFDEQNAERVLRVIEKHHHVKGEMEGKPLLMQPWQCFSITTPFGWWNKQAPWVPRFTRSYLEIPKGNGKSPMSAALGNTQAFLSGKKGLEVYSCATSVEQANYVFEPAQRMLERMPRICERNGIQVRSRSIIQPSTGNYFKVLSSERNSPEGSLPYFLIVDELHAHPDRHFFDNLNNAAGKRRDAMLWMVTTAGTDMASVCYEKHQYVASILMGEHKDESYFGLIYTIDEEDDWATVEAARKANPNYGVSVFPETIETALTEALATASTQTTYKTKRLNIWQNADSNWINPQKWALCSDSKLKLEDYTGKEVVIGNDVANKIDILAKMYLFWEDKKATHIDDKTGEEKVVAKRHYYVFGKYWLPEETVHQAQNAQYRGWATSKVINTCWGAENDYDEFEDSIRADAAQFRVREAAFDEWGSEMIIQHLNRDGIVSVKVAQNTKNFSPAMRELEAAVAEGRFHFNGDPVLTWAIKNVKCHPDHNDNLFPNKAGENKKIDPVTALLTALNRLMTIAIEAPKDFWWSSSSSAEQEKK